MKDKNLAAILAFFGGTFGLHRFYLGQIGLGILYCIFFPIAAMIGVLDAIIFLSMSEASFDDKYNRDLAGQPRGTTAAPTGNYSKDRYERYRQREAQRRSGARSVPNQRSSTAAPRASNRGVADSRVKQKVPARGNVNREAGIRFYKDYDYERAIKAFELSLQEEPRDIATHWNIACCYSLTEDADKAMYHLDRAVALGFDDFERIREHDALAYLRIQPAYLKFAENDFRLSPLAAPPAGGKAVGDTLSPIDAEQTTQKAAAPAANLDLLEQLSRLGQLREKGLLTEAEFASQKRKLLG